METRGWEAIPNVEALCTLGGRPPAGVESFVNCGGGRLLQCCEIGGHCRDAGNMYCMKYSTNPM